MQSPFLNNIPSSLRRRTFKSHIFFMTCYLALTFKNLHFSRVHKRYTSVTYIEVLCFFMIKLVCVCVCVFVSVCRPFIIVVLKAGSSMLHPLAVDFNWKLTTIKNACISNIHTNIHMKRNNSRVKFYFTFLWLNRITFTTYSVCLYNVYTSSMKLFEFSFGIPMQYKVIRRRYFITILSLLVVKNWV